jgi:hypothetical protein
MVEIEVEVLYMAVEAGRCRERRGQRQMKRRILSRSEDEGIVVDGKSVTERKALQS